MRLFSHRALPHLTAALALVLAACSGGDYGETDDAPLGSYDDLFAGAPDNSTLPDENKADTVYPAQHTALLELQTPVKSQGSRGVCSIFATVALMEHLYLKAGAQNPDFSEQYLQWSVKAQAGEYTWTDGSNGDANLRAIARYGVPVESAWPYEPSPWTATNDPACGAEENKPIQCYTNGEPPEAAVNGPLYTLPAPRYLNTNSIKAHITEKGTGVIVGLDFFYQSWNHRRSTLPVNAEWFAKGYVTAPNADDVTESHKQRAGHAITIVGWDDTLELPRRDKDGNPTDETEKGFYIFKNSWGTDKFGVENPHGAGYGYLSMEYVHRYGSAVVAGVPTSLEPTINPEPVDPGPGSGSYENSTAYPIPDDSTTGASSTIDVSATGTVSGVTVTVDITHTYSGDLTIRLRHAGRVATLKTQSGDGTANVQKSFTTSAFDGLDKAGTWTLEVVDGVEQDTGTLNSWSLAL